MPALRFPWSAIAGACRAMLPALVPMVKELMFVAAVRVALPAVIAPDVISMLALSEVIVAGPAPALSVVLLTVMGPPA